MKHLLTIIVIFLFSCTTLSAQGNGDEIIIGTKHTIQSDILAEEREYWVYLPPNYDKTRAYPVIYVLDGDRSFDFASAILRQMSDMAKIPEMIMVSILNTDRDRDMTPTHIVSNEYNENTGGADQFLAFLEIELIPFIEENYSTADSKSLSGHSLTGLFALYTYIEKPQLFRNILSIDPTIDWDNYYLLKKLQTQTPRKTSSNTIFITAVDISQYEGTPFYDEKELDYLAIDNFIKINKKTHGENLRSEQIIIPNETHGSIELLSFYRGLEYFFEGYLVNVPEITNNPSYLISHFDNISKKFGYHIPPHEGAVNYVAYNLLNEGRVNEALKYFKLNIENFPYSANTHDSISDAYKALGDREMVIKSLEKALELDPDFGPSKRKLEEILKNE